MEDSILGLFYVLFCCVYIVFEIGITVIAIGSLVFWIIMLIDAIKREYQNENDKIMWILLLVFTGSIGALVYFFVEYRKKHSKAKKSADKDDVIIK
ncbi:PLDc N-terminal domain-containing protein [Candidatus Dojkabacteria bacterium]|nr:PLDc N-terminal domain-containing protein [Candidatus Dojkabacteria bacterium]